MIAPPVATLADIEHLESTPIDAHGWPSSTYELLERAARHYEQASALTWIPDARNYKESRTWTFRALFNEVTRTANLFHELGCTSTSTIAYLLPNLPATHFALWGAQATGVALALNPALSAEHLVALLIAAKAEVLVLAPEALSESTRDALAVQLRSCPTLRTLLSVDAEFRADGLETIDFYSARTRQPADRLLSGRVFRANERSSCFCTGGTTGAPKIAVRTHGAEVADAHMLAIVIAGQIHAQSRGFCGLPLFHVNAILVTGLAPWINGAEIVLGPALGYRDSQVVKNFWKIVEHYRITLFSGVPTILGSLLNTPIDGADLSSLRIALCGAAPMPVELFRRFERETGIRILEGYGLTETTCTASLNPIDGERPVGSIGLRLPYQRIRVVELDGAGRMVRECAIDEIGVLAIAGPNVFEGYVDPQHNEAAWVDCGDGQRWLNTGDLGRVDARGYFWLAGRRKELIIRGGHNIDPRSIEEALHRHPAVALAAAVGSPDAHSGEIPVAYVELRHGSNVPEEELLQFAATNISERAAVPKRVYILGALPTTAVGKLFKPALVLAEIERTVRREAAALSVEIGNLSVQQHAKWGPCAQVEVAGDGRELAQVLGAYAFRCEITSMGAVAESHS